MKVLIILIFMSCIVTAGAQAEFKIGVAENYIAITPSIVDDFIELYERANIKDVTVHVFPGGRMLGLAQQGQIDAVEARFKSAMRDFDLIAVDAPIYLELKQYAWGHKDADIQITRPEDFAEFEVLGSRDNRYSVELADQHNFEIASSSEVALNMLKLGRVDLLIMSDVELGVFVRSGLIQPDMLEPKSGVLTSEWLYHFVHPRHADKVEVLAETIKTLQQEGRFQIGK